VLDGDPAPPPKKGKQLRNFWPMSCGQMAEWINMPLGMEVVLGPCDIVLDGDPVPPEKGDSPHQFTVPQFSAHSYCGQTAGWMKMQFGTEVDFDPGHIVLYGDPAPPTERDTTPLLFSPCLLWPRSPISAVAKLFLQYLRMVS